MVKHNRESIIALVGLAITFLLVSLLFAVPLSVAQIVTVPSTEVEADFVVNPDGSVELAAKGNMTNIFPGSVSALHIDAQVGKDDGMNRTSVNATLALPPEQASQFPFNTTSASATTRYSNGMASSRVNASIVLPNSLSMPGMPINFSGFPFDSLDFALSAKYANQSFNGTITVHLVPGFTFGDVHVNFEGNLTEVVVSDSVEVFYNYTLPIPGFPILSEGYLSQLLQDLNSTITGEGSGSIYNMTLGTLECTTFSTIITRIDANSASVSFFVVIQGDFISFLTSMYSNLARASGSPGGIPISGLNLTALYPLFNASFNATKSADLTMSYSKANRRFDVQADSTSDLREYWSAMAEVYPSLFPPPMQSFIQSMFNETFLSVNSLNSLNETMSYSNGRVNFSNEVVFAGDLNGEVNYLKNAFINMTEQTGPSQSMLSVLKETEVDVSNLKLSLDVQNLSTFWSFENVRVTPPTDPINATCFKLQRFFNLTSSPYEPPLQNQQLKLIVQGGNNGTHSVTLSIDPNDPEKPSDPDQFGSDNTMIWNNMSISKLKSLIFKVWQGYAETIFTSASVTQASPFTIDAEETAGCTLTLTNISRSATISVRNTTSPSDVGSTPATYKMLGSYIQITTDSTDVAVNGTIRIYYKPEQLAASGLSESDLKIYYWDASTSTWIGADTQIDTTQHCAWSVVNHLSTWALLEQPGQALWQQPWFIASIAIAVAAVIIIAVVALRRKKPAPPETKAAETSQQTQ
jgi:hypothetical protein